MSLVQVRWIDRLVSRSLVIHMTNGESVRGFLVAAYRDSLVLRHGVHLGSVEGSSVEIPIDGEATIPRERVAWIQTLPNGEV